MRPILRMAALLLTTMPLAACFEEPANEQERLALSEELPEGRTFDNPFDANSADTADATVVDNIEASDPIADAPSDPVVTADPGPVTPYPAPTGRSCDDGKRVCRDMDSCEDAMFHLQQCGMSRLDGDSDGSPCEKLCGQGG